MLDGIACLKIGSSRRQAGDKAASTQPDREVPVIWVKFSVAEYRGHGKDDGIGRGAQPEDDADRAVNDQVRVAVSAAHVHAQMLHLAWAQNAPRNAAAGQRGDRLGLRLAHEDHLSHVIPGHPAVNLSLDIRVQ
jgi:hypothetical protein